MNQNFSGLFEWAINALQQQRPIKREGWDFTIRLMGTYIARSDDGGTWEPTTADLLARDWGAA